MLDNEGFNLVFDTKDGRIIVVYTNIIQDSITFDKETIKKIEELSTYHKVSVMKYFSDTLQTEMTKKIDMYVQQAFKTIVNEQYKLMEEKQKK